MVRCYRVLYVRSFAVPRIAIKPMFSSLLESLHDVLFENVFMYSKLLQQPTYRYLENSLSSIDEIAYFTFSNNSDVIPPSEAHPNSIFIFDDVACDKQDAVREYFSMGRHSHVDCFYLCQSYARIPKYLIRDNTNSLILFKQDSTNLKHVYDNHVNTFMSYKDFSELCRNCWQQKYEFLVINKDNALNNGSEKDLTSLRYRGAISCYRYTNVGRTSHG